jgi:hypothetical protein
MESNLRQPLVCPEIIGRELRLAALERLLGAIRNGSGQVVLISGEAGLGKRRIPAELTAMARGSGLVLLSGQCFEPESKPFLRSRARSLARRASFGWVERYSGSSPIGGTGRTGRGGSKVGCAGAGGTTVGRGGAGVGRGPVDWPAPGS